MIINMSENRKDIFMLRSSFSIAVLALSNKQKKFVDIFTIPTTFSCTAYKKTAVTGFLPNDSCKS